MQKNGLPAVLYEDDDCIVINKRAGLAVHGGAGIKVSVETLLAAHLKTKPFLVHRLDKDTSGVLLAAKSKDAAAFYAKAITSRAVRKQYLAVCARKSGTPHLASRGVLESVLAYQDGDKQAVTHYHIQHEISHRLGDFVVFELELGTGRMHQLRRQLADAGFPILGDDKYGDWPLNKMLRKECALKHLLLHAQRLIITRPCGNLLDLSIPPPEYWAAFINPQYQ